MRSLCGCLSSVFQMMEEFTTPIEELLDVQGGLSDLPKAVAVYALEHSR